jgi:hypothetical protein
MIIIIMAGLSAGAAALKVRTVMINGIELV